MNVIIVNAYKIIYTSTNQSFSKLLKNEAHKHFRSDLATKLFRRFERLKTFSLNIILKRSNVQKTFYDLVVHTSAKAHESLRKLKKFSIKKCEACKDAERVIINVKKRKSLEKLYFNNLIINKRRNRASRILFKCFLCRISFCNHKQYWNKHKKMIYKNNNWI